MKQPQNTRMIHTKRNFLKLGSPKKRVLITHLSPSLIPIENTIITTYWGDGIDVIHSSARSESWNEYINNIGIEETSPYGLITTEQMALIGRWVLEDPIQWGWKVENYEI
jgi:hypothetical protein